MCLAAIINQDATVMCQRQLRDAIYFSQSTPLHGLMMQLSTVVVNCRWIAHRWNLLTSSLCRLGAEGWLDVWKVKRLCETWAAMSLPSASSLPHQSPSISSQVIVLSDYPTQTTKGGEAIRAYAVCPWAFCTQTEGDSDTQATALIAKVQPEDLQQASMLPVVTGFVEWSASYTLEELQQPISQPASQPASITFSSLSCLLLYLVSLWAY